MPTTTDTDRVKSSYTPKTVIHGSDTTITQLLRSKNIGGGVSLSRDLDGTVESLLASDKPHQYAIGRLIAEGGMGLVLSAKDLNCRRDVAMKVIGDKKTISNEQILRFIIEAQITAQLEHPSIIPVYELNVDENEDVYYTMKFVHGGTLVDKINNIRKGQAETIEKYSLMRLLRTFVKICEAMAFAHSRGILHRDLKPENIMIGDFGEVLIMDWGLAKLVNGEPQATTTDCDNEDYKTVHSAIESVLTDAGMSDSLKTLDGQIMGTPGFMPPEQALGKTDDVDARSDIYALGGILYNLLTLRPSIVDTDLKEIVRKIVIGDIRPPSSFNDEKPFPHCPNGKIPETLSAIAMKALQATPSDRYQSVDELREDIENYFGGYSTSVDDQSLTRQLFLLLKRRRKEIIWASAFIVIIVAMITGFMVTIINQKNVAEDNLNKFLQEREARNRITQIALIKSLEALRATNPGQSTLASSYEIVESEIALNLSENRDLREITAISDLPLRRLDLTNTGVTDIRSLSGLSLNWLSLRNTKVSDIGALAQMKLNFLDLSGTLITTLAPLVNSSPKFLNIAGTPIGDMNILTEMDLTGLTINRRQLKYSYILVDLDLDHLGIVDIDNDHTRSLSGMNLTSLELEGRKLNNLRKLQDMKLSRLVLLSTKVRDLRPLRKMPLSSLRIRGGMVKDISVVQYLPLTEIRLEKCYFLKDISPILKCKYLQKLLIPPHFTNIDGLRELTGLTVLANTVADFEKNQSPKEFWKKHQDHSIIK